MGLGPAVTLINETGRASQPGLFGEVISHHKCPVEDLGPFYQR